MKKKKKILKIEDQLALMNSFTFSVHNKNFPYSEKLLHVFANDEDDDDDDKEGLIEFIFL